MRVELSDDDDRAQLGQFAGFLLAVGDGRFPAVHDLGSDWIKLDDHVP